eukprot:TRINITY_DN13762_c0_g1_i2.p1 TRINITY_DN13762_c0_g1~~TRINITY_DN13762_c0_g1_i2.p1  ORF type:complete len:365 (-),score=85.55 TRINITY_DN13762_c0_g1_i2:195-1289(-)
MPGCNAFPRGPGEYGSFVAGLIDGPIAGPELHEAEQGSQELRLQEQVEEIHWQSITGAEDVDVAARRVRLLTTAGTQYFAKRAVVTLPLGVLKAGRVAFTPPLPQWKIDAIERLGCGSMNRIFLRFSKHFWKSSVYTWNICGLNAAVAELKSKGTLTESLASAVIRFEHARFFAKLVPQSKVPAGEGVLCVQLCGANATAMEEFSDEDIAAAAMVVLGLATRCANAKNVFINTAGELPKPKAVHASRWMSDPFSGISWTASILGSRTTDYETLAKPLGPQRELGFAGEHTTFDSGGTVHGAWLTGLREAEAVLMACLREGHFAQGEATAEAVAWMLHCKDAVARAQALEDAHAETDSSSSSSED